LIPYALGSETSGSILTPASYCGVTGLRPTYGLVSRHGAMALSWTLDKLGVLAHSAEDCALVLHAIAGGDDDDPGSAQKSFYYAPQYYERFADLKVAYAEGDFAEWPAAELRPAFATALAAVKGIGSKMVESRLPEFPYGTVISCIIDAEAASVFEQLIRSGRVNELADQGQIDGLKASMNYSAVDYLKAMRVRTQIMQALRQVFADVDLIVAPTKMEAPERADRPFDQTPMVRPDKKGMWAGLVQATNLAGLPAITVPCGLPIGLQIVGPVFSENRIIAFAREFQKRTEFHKVRPVVG
jgi:aspartyl-tRNA(Asn)/glutamyl-tRNA(Gln) amidotransferase subunit A